MNTMKDQIKRIQKAVGTVADGIWGSKTLQAVADRLGCAADLRAVQRAVYAAVDGVLGAETVGKVYAVLGLGWPTQAEVRTGRSIFGKAGDERNLVSIETPYPLYYEGKRVQSIRVHKLVANAVRAALEEVLEHYGLEKIHELGLDDYSGSYNYRATQSGSAMSMHAWGIALDFAASKNSLRQTARSASLAKPECKKWWEIWESYGATSLGRARDYDWMHLQFASL